MFVGTVIDSKTVTFKHDNYTEGMRLVRFSIDEGFRGAEGAQIEVLTGFGGGDCGFGFTQTKQYLVYAYENQDGTLATSICTRTKAVKDAAEDLAYIHGLSKAKPGSTINVEVVKYSRGADSNLVSSPLGQMRINISGEQQNKALKTDEKGRIVLDGLPPGSYEVSISLPDGLITGEPKQKVEVADRGCAFVYFGVEANGRLSGRVLNAAGMPVSKAEIFLVDADKQRYQGHFDYAYSDDDGNYSFRRTPSGRYVLLIRFDGLTSQTRPFPVVYYPGVPEKSQAQVFTFGEGQSFEKVNLLTPPMPQEYEVEGTVEAPQATPVRVGYMVAGDSILYSVPVNAEGQFRFKAYEGLRLVINATQQISQQKVLQSNWAEVTVVAGLPPVKLIIKPQ